MYVCVSMIHPLSTKNAMSSCLACFDDYYIIHTIMHLAQSESFKLFGRESDCCSWPASRPANRLFLLLVLQPARPLAPPSIGGRGGKIEILVFSFVFFFALGLGLVKYQCSSLVICTHSDGDSSPVEGGARVPIYKILIRTSLLANSNVKLCTQLCKLICLFYCLCLF